MLIIIASGENRTGAATGGGGSVDPILQPFVDGEYDGGPVEVFEGNFPDPDTDLLLVATTFLGVDTVVSSTEIDVSFADNTPSVIANSDASQPKYLRITKPGGSGPLFYSLGLVSDDFDPDLVIDRMDFTIDDIVDFASRSLNAVAIDIVDVGVTPSTLTPGAGTPYTAVCQMRTTASAVLHRIGRVLTPTMATVSGAGGGTIAETSSGVITNRYGVSETLHCTAGAGGSVERIDVIDQDNFTGSSANITDQNLNAIMTFAFKDAAYDGSNAPYTRTGITIVAGGHMLVRSMAFTSVGGNVPSHAGLTFTLLAAVDHPVTTERQTFYVAPCPSGYSGNVTFSGTTFGEGQAFAEIVQITTDVPVTNITAVSANTVSREVWTGGAPAVFDISYAQTFTDPNNAGVSMFRSVFGGTSTPRAGWTETSDTTSGSETIACQSRPSPDTKATATYASSGVYVLGLIAELVGVPT